MRAHIGLAGTWRLRLDPADEGVAARWYERPPRTAVRLPGSLQSQGHGHPVTVDTPWTGRIQDRSFYDDPSYAPYRQPPEVKVPFWLQPHGHYVGAAWYQREIEIPPSWAGRPLTLTLERPHWTTRVWCDGQEAPCPDADSLSVPHVHDLGALAAGRHRLTVRVDNRLAVDVGVDAHSVTDHTQTNWNGIVGDITCDALPRHRIEDVRVYPDLSRRTARIVLQLHAPDPSAASGTLALTAALCHPEPAAALPAQTVTWSGEAEVACDYPLGADARPWDEFDPALYRLTVRLEAGGEDDEAQATFGLREFAADGTQFTVNGRPVFLRGTLECAIFPLTGHPPTDLAAWTRVCQAARAYGLNHLRFHSWCPPEAAFAAADREGIYLQVEGPVWTAVGAGEPVDEWLHAESERILRQYGNHPSFVLFAHGNEPHGDGHEAYLAEWVRRRRAEDPRRLYTSGSGWPAIPENDYHVTPAPRIKSGGPTMECRLNAHPPETQTDYREQVAAAGVPLVGHEVGQWCAFPDLQATAKYDGALKAHNFEIFRDSLRARGMIDQADAFHRASGKLQAICYKEEVESALRTPGFAGFQLLGVQDFPGQGTALVGVADPFWDPKPYLSPAAWRRFCAPTVVLARLAKRVWTSAEALEADLEVCHFGAAALAGASVEWRLEDAVGRAVARGVLPVGAVAAGVLRGVGRVRLPLGGLAAPGRYRLVAALAGAENDWNLWVFPPGGEEAARGLWVARAWDGATRARLRAGGRVLLLPPAGQVAGDAALGFSPVFWNTAWFHNEPPHTLGLCCDTEHGALAGFPTEGHGDWQWWELVAGGAAFVLDALPLALRPIVQPIDTWFRNHRLGLLFEARVGRGRLMVSGMDLCGDLERRPAAAQMRRSVLAYMRGDGFAPSVQLSPGQVAGLLRPAER